MAARKRSIKAGCREFSSTKVGATIFLQGHPYRIIAITGVETLSVQDRETGTVREIRTGQIEAPPDTPSPPIIPLPQIADADWREAKERYAVIKPFLAGEVRGRKAIAAAAKAAQTNPATLYRWLKQYRETETLDSLVSTPSGPAPGAELIDPTVNAIIAAAIDEVYLTRQRHKAQHVVDEVFRRCRIANISPPHANTIRQRIKRVRPETVLRRRGMGEQARNKHEAIRASFPNADFPLAVVQMDHTPADIIVVDEKTRQPMGRPWITVAIDVFSRMVVGFYASMDAPSAVAVGMCLKRAIMPKDDYLRDLGVPGSWPVWGLMSKVHTDNAKEFRGKMLVKACENYSINLEFRPVRRPHFGGHIERMMGTLANEISKLPGTTFSSHKARKGYNSEKEAKLTLIEFERLIVDFLVNVYHLRPHSGLGKSPLKRWEEGILGTSSQRGMGQPPIPTDLQRLEMEFLPFVKRQILPYGILIDKIQYYHEVLRPWISAELGGKKQQFLIRYDPRDMSKVHFFDPHSERYFPIPLRRLGEAAFSRVELRDAKRNLAAEGKRDADQAAIFDAMNRARDQITQATADTKKARQKRHRRAVTADQAQRPMAMEKPLVLPAADDPFDQDIPVFDIDITEVQ